MPSARTWPSSWQASGSPSYFDVGLSSAASWLGSPGWYVPRLLFVFATVAAIPLAGRRWRDTRAFVGWAVVPAVTQLGATYLGERSYATVQLYDPTSVLDVAFSATGAEVYWGLGMAPWVGLGLAALLVLGGVWARVPTYSPGRLLLGGWIVWNLIYAWLAARGSIPTQHRVYVMIHLLGAMAIAVAAHEVFKNARRSAAVVGVVAAVAVVFAGFAAAEARQEWREAYPADVAAVSKFLAGASNEDGLLSDWLWWREWTFGVYGIRPGGEACNYFLHFVCAVASDSMPPARLTGGLSEAEVERLVQAWRFIDTAPPRFIVLLTEPSYAEWRAWEEKNNPEVLSSFVRPLLKADGDCYRTVDGLPAISYCPVFTSGRFVVLGRI